MAIPFFSNVDLKQNQLANAVAQILGSDPGSPVEGQFWYRSDLHQLRLRLAASTISLGSGSGTVTSVTAGNTTITIAGTATDPTVAVAKTLDSTYLTDMAAAVALNQSGKANARVVSLSNVVVATGTLLTIDGVTLVAGDRVLLTGQTTTTENGVWIASAGAWSRSADMASGVSCLGLTIYVFAGTLNAKTAWIQTNATAAVVATTALVFASAGPFGGTGLTTTGNTLSVTYGSASGTAAQGNDARFTGAAGGDLAGNYPNPTVTSTANFKTQVRTVTLDTMAAPIAAVALNAQKITGLANGSAASDAAAFGQIPTALPPNGAAGGDLTGTYPNPTVTSTANFKTQVATVRLDQMAAPTASVAMNSQKITGLLAGTAGTDAINLTQLNAATQGLSVKSPVRVIATANGTLASSFQNGSVVDGVTLATGDRIVLAGQTTVADRGIYTVNVSGAPTRALDADASGELQVGTFVYVSAGTVNANTQWVVSATTSTPWVPGTDGSTWTFFFQATATQAGAGLTATGNILAVGAGTGIVVNADNIAVDRVTNGSMVTFKYAQLIGDGSTTAIVVTHNLGTRDVVMSVQDAATFAIVFCDMAATTTNTATFTFSVAPASNAYRVSIIG